MLVERARPPMKGFRMATVDVDELSVRALRTLLLIYRTRSVSQSAELLGQDQSSVSYTLQKLRRAFSDSLFVRVGKGFQPTERCVDLVNTIERAVAHIDETLAERQFVPATSRRRFTISSNYLERAIFLAPLIRQLRRHAPGVTLDIIPSGGGGSGYRQLMAAECDVLLSPIPVPGEKIHHQLLARDHYTCFADAEFHGKRKKLTQSEWLASTHLIVTYGNQFEPAFLKTLDPKSETISRINCASTSDLPSMLKDTDLIATAPSLLAPVMGPEFVNLPFPFARTSLEFFISWTHRTNTDPAYRWMRERIISIAADIVR